MVSHTRMGLGVTDEVRERNREWEQRREKGIEGVRELGMKDRESVREKLGGYKGEREKLVWSQILSLGHSFFLKKIINKQIQLL